MTTTTREKKSLEESCIDLERARRNARRVCDAEERGPFAPPEIATLTTMLAEPDEETFWRVEHLQPTGTRVVLAAQFKAGKTTLVANVIRSLLDGDPFLGKYPVAKVEGTILLLDFEMNKKQLKRWYRDHHIRTTDRVVIVSMRGHAARFNLADTTVRAWWVTQLRTWNVKYIIVDCLRPILDALGIDERSEVGTFFVPFDALLAEAEVEEAMVVHHMGHAKERSRGDSRVRDWPEIEWRLVRKSDDPASTRFLSAFGRDVNYGEQQLEYDSETRRLTVAGGSRRDANVDEALPEVLEFIETAATPPTRNQIVKGLKGNGHGQKNIKSAIKLGITRGRIVVTPGPRNSQLHSIVTEARAETSECAM